MEKERTQELARDYGLFQCAGKIYSYTAWRITAENARIIIDNASEFLVAIPREEAGRGAEEVTLAGAWKKEWETKTEEKIMPASYEYDAWTEYHDKKKRVMEDTDGSSQDCWPTKPSVI